MRQGAVHGVTFSLRGGYDAISLICAGGMRILTCSCRGGASSTVGRSRKDHFRFLALPEQTILLWGMETQPAILAC